MIFREGEAHGWGPGSRQRSQRDSSCLRESRTRVSTQHIRRVDKHQQLSVIHTDRRTRLGLTVDNCKPNRTVVIVLRTGVFFFYLDLFFVFIFHAFLPIPFNFHMFVIKHRETFNQIKLKGNFFSVENIFVRETFWSVSIASKTKCSPMFPMDLVT